MWCRGVFHFPTFLRFQADNRVRGFQEKILCSQSRGALDKSSTCLDVQFWICQKRGHAASEKNLHVPGVTRMLHICVASYHQPTVPPIGFSVGATDLSNYPRVAENAFAAVSRLFALYPTPTPTTHQPAILPFLPAGDGRCERSTPLTHHIEGGLSHTI